MMFGECVPVYVHAVLDGIEIDEYLIVDVGTAPIDVVNSVSEAYDLSDQARNRLFEVISPQLRCNPCSFADPRRINIDISVKGLRLRHRVLFDAENASPFDLADQLIVDNGLARSMEEYWIWNKMIVFSILWNYYRSTQTVDSPGLEIVSQ